MVSKKKSIVDDESLEERIESIVSKSDFVRLQQEFADEKQFNIERTQYERNINDLERTHDKSIWKERLVWITIVITLFSAIIIILVSKGV